MDTDFDPEGSSKDLMLSRASTTVQSGLERLWSAAVVAFIWVVCGAILVLFWGVWPKTIGGWVVWAIAAPVIYLLGEAIFYLIALPIAAVFKTPAVNKVLEIIKKTPPLSWVLRWLRCEDGEGEPVLRFAALAFTFLIVVLFALGVFSP